MAPSTSLRTLYRLVDVVPNRDGMRAALDHEQLASLDAEFHDAHHERLPVPWLFLSAGIEKEKAAWCDEIARTTGCDVSERVRRTAALLMLAVDGEVYAIGYDQGYRLIPDRLKDRRFGLRYAARQVDPLQVRGLIAHTMGEARTDIALVPGGTSVTRFGVREHQQFVTSLRGVLQSNGLTRAQSGRGVTVSVEGGAGLRLPLGIEPADLVADIREIARVCRDDSPDPALEFVEHITPVKDTATLALLEQELEAALGDPADGRITLGVPGDHWTYYQAAGAVQLRIDGCGVTMGDAFELDHVLDRLRTRPAGGRLAALRRSTVTLYRHHRAAHEDRLVATPLLRWIEAGISLGERRFLLMDCEWYETGARYLAAIKDTVTRLINRPPSVELPAWEPGEKEDLYNESIARMGDGYVCLDRKNVGNPLKAGNEVEICDVLTPDNTLVLVKRAHRSGPLSHLFSQGLVAVQMLKESAEVRAQFARKVFEQSRGRRIMPLDFVPRRLVFGILLKDGTEELTPETLFPFSQVTLVETAKTLRSWGVEVEVVGIRAAPSRTPRAA
ncbi:MULTISPECIES: DUF6119 family protein [Streptomyces]|uniref:DUF6119 family protein n=1 Tax=Streptomyces eurythermus TaxID=42237 RepID=A0ABW6YZL1_9ACTN|nr:MULTISPECIES: DUF6119 family protein [Streptomyces]QIS69671.1 TIGR04141 family sporadically distributed protein [Streptomyces sp. DSM 40868]